MLSYIIYTKLTDLEQMNNITTVSMKSCHTSGIALPSSRHMLSLQCIAYN